MARLRTSAFAGLALLAQSFGASAQQASTPDKDRDVVVVTGKETEEAIRNFIGEVAVATRGENMARWDRNVCPSVVGMPVSYAQPILDQFARRALDVGLEVDGPGCVANVLIMVSMNPDGVAQTLYDNYKKRLGYYDHSAKTLGRGALKDFVKSDAAVRWWHVNYTRTRDGRTVQQPLTPEDRFPKVNISGGPSRMFSNERQDAAMAFLIVDGRRLQGMNLATLADYLAMASLAQIDPKADMSEFATILNLFDADRDAEAKPVALTKWDEAYLQGLYGARRDAASAQTQQGEIGRDMLKDLAK